MNQRIEIGPLHATIRECWIDANNKRLSGDYPGWTDRPTIHAVAIQNVVVSKPHQRQGHFSRFLDSLCADPRYEMVVVEGVQNPMLAAWLERQGWEFDAGVMDFYQRKER